MPYLTQLSVIQECWMALTCSPIANSFERKDCCCRSHVETCLDPPSPAAKKCISGLLVAVHLCSLAHIFLNSPGQDGAGHVARMFARMIAPLPKLAYICIDILSAVRMSGCRPLAAHIPQDRLPISHIYRFAVCSDLPGIAQVF